MISVTANLPRVVKCITCEREYDPYRSPTCPSCKESKWEKI